MSSRDQKRNASQDSSARRRNTRGNGFGVVERLESRVVLSAESAFMLVPPGGVSDAADAARAVFAPIATTGPIAPVSTTSSPVVAARLQLTIPAEVRAGVRTALTAVALDSAGRPVPSFTGSATVSSSDGAASLPLVEVVFRNGRASFAVTFATAGRQTVTVTSLADPAITATASTAVTAAPTPSAFLVVMPQRAAAGTPVTLSITAVDAARRPIPGFAGTASLASSDSAAALPASVNFVNGRATALVTFATAGRQTVTVRGGAAGQIVARAVTQVSATQPASRFSVVLPQVVAVGAPVSVTLVAVDAQGRPVPTFSGTATLSSSDSAAKLPNSVRFVDGRATVRVTFGTLGEQTLTVDSGPSLGGGIVGIAKTLVGEVVTQRIRTLPATRA